MQQHRHTIAAALEQLGLGDPERLQMLLAYGDSLVTHACASGLIGDSDQERILNRHILENLAPATQIDRELCLDMGTGAGLPGMVLALAMPRTNWLLLDGRKRCADFLRRQVELLKPGNVTVVECRAEQYQPAKRPGLVISRAFAPLARYHRLAAKLTDGNGRILGIKGRRIDKEKAELAAMGVACSGLELAVPASDSTIMLVELAAAPSGNASVR